MPLKSDGSLCIMEALSRSQSKGMVSTTTPKLENFLGGATMGAHHYGNSEKEAMSLSLDSMYYNHHDSEVGNNRHHSHSLNLLHQSFRQHQQHYQIQVQQHHHHHPYFSTLTNHEMYQAQLDNHNTTKENHLVACNPSLPQVSEDGVGGFRNWVSRNYCQEMEQKLDGGFMVGGDEGGGYGSVCAMWYGDLQSLSLSKSPGSQSSCITAPPPQQISPTGGGGNECVVAMETTKKRGSGGKVVGQKQPVHRKSIDTFGQRTSQYRGVTRHRWTGRYEAHLWDNSCKKEGQTRKGRQVYLGGYDMEEKGARAYDLAALKYWGPSTYINFSLENYQEELESMKNMSRQEYIAHLRRKSSGFSRSASIYRGASPAWKMASAHWQGRREQRPLLEALISIMLFADLHYGENAWDDWGPQHDADSDKCLTTLLDSENLDFVVYLGDVLTANNFAVANATKYWDKAIAPTRAKGIPWASVFGSHDDAPFVWPLEWFSGMREIDNDRPTSVLPDELDILQEENESIEAKAPLKSTPKEKEKEKQRKQERAGVDEPKPKEKHPKGAGSGFLAPLTLSDALANFLGTGESDLSRSDVIKKLWDYIKEHKL